MPSICGKAAKSLRTNMRKTGERLSTVVHMAYSSVTNSGVKAQVIRDLFPRFPTRISPGNVAVSPLAEHYFYPVSTAPINNCNQMN